MVLTYYRATRAFENVLELANENEADRLRPFISYCMAHDGRLSATEIDKLNDKIKRELPRLETVIQDELHNQAIEGETT